MLLPPVGAIPSAASGRVPARITSTPRYLPGRAAHTTPAQRNDITPSEVPEEAMTAVVLIPLVLQLVVPLALIGWVALSRGFGRAPLLLDVAIAAAYVCAIAVAGLWLVLPWYLPAVYLALLGAAVMVRLRREAGSAEPPSVPLRHRPLGLAIRSVVLLACLAVTGRSLAGWRLPDGSPVDLAFPLDQGTYLVAAGGSNGLLSPHVTTLTGERYAPFRGQSFGVDLVALGAWGSRASGPFPSDPSGFAIFGHEVHAPCAGTVVAAVDGRPDEHEGQVPRSELTGNHVIVECAGVWVVLAHMQWGSVAPGEGDRVDVGDVLGRVGNSGQSDEPHLHVHAQTPGTAEAPIGGDPVPVTFDGDYLVRNERVQR
jgi:hypothetical protein